MNKSRKIALIFIWHNKPLASWVMYPVPTLNIKHCFRFLSYTILIGNGENESRMKDMTKTSCFLLSNPFILTLIVLAIWAYEPHAFSVSEIWTVRGTGAGSWKRSKDSKSRENRVRIPKISTRCTYSFKCKCSVLKIKIDWPVRSFCVLWAALWPFRRPSLRTCPGNYRMQCGNISVHL